MKGGLMTYVLAIDQGTTSSRAILFDCKMDKIAMHQVEFQQFYPALGWVEHDPEEIWHSVVDCCRRVIEKAGINPTEIVSIGITNQRETTLVWDKNTGNTIYPAIVWQDRRTADFCAKLESDSHIVGALQQKTGLLLDSYFSATKISWILKNVEGARQRAENGELLFGTIDSFILWRLTAGKNHSTDVTNASRTLLFNIHEFCWDDDLLSIFNIPKVMMPEVLACDSDYGVTKKEILGVSIPIRGTIGDQQAATVGQCCFRQGMVKSTYGTGCFMLMNTGEKACQSQNKLLTTIAYSLNGEVAYGLEGSIFNAGTVIKWLRDQMHLITSAAETEDLAASVIDNAEVYFVPAFTGLGAPYWDAHARGAIVGLTRDTDKAHIVRAALEAVCYRTKDLLLAMQKDSSAPITCLRVDGGMVANNWLMQFLSDILQLQIDRPCCIETTALGAALVAGLGSGLFSDLGDIESVWRMDRCFDHSISHNDVAHLYAGWQKAVNRVL